jgi:phosphoribosylanthranilate isomerase
VPKSFARIPYVIHSIGFMFGPILACISLAALFMSPWKNSMPDYAYGVMYPDAIILIPITGFFCGFFYSMIASTDLRLRPHPVRAVSIVLLWPIIAPAWFIRRGRRRLKAYYKRCYPTYQTPRGLAAWILFGWIALLMFAVTSETPDKMLLVADYAGGFGLCLLFCLALTPSRWRGSVQARRMRILIMLEKNMFWGVFLFSILNAGACQYFYWRETDVFLNGHLVYLCCTPILLPALATVQIVFLFTLDSSLTGDSKSKDNAARRRLNQFVSACTHATNDRDRSRSLPFQVKVCGLTDPKNAAEVEAAGVDAVGLNFYPKSKRYVEPEVAKEIVEALSSKVVKIGLFVNAPSEQVKRLNSELGLDFVQLHGDETPAYIAGLGSEIKIIRAYRVGEKGLDPIIADLARCAELKCLPIAVLLDAFSQGEYGGTGTTSDWDAAAEFSRGDQFPPLVLAGGLTPENVADAIATVLPDAVDTAGGVESAPGVKDPELTRRFAEAALDAFGSAALSDSE